MSLKRTIAFHSLFLSSSTYYTMVLAGITSFIVAKILGPSNYGIISGIQVIVLFASLSHFGFLQAANVELPALRVKEDKEGIQKCLYVTFVMTMVPTLIATAIIVLIALSKMGEVSPVIFWGIITLAFVLLFNQLLQLVINTHIRGWNRFEVQSKAQAIASTIVYPLTVVMVLIAGIYGQFGCQVLFPILYVLIIARFIHLTFGKGWSWTVWKRMFRIGFPIMLTAFLATSTGNIDRFIILSGLPGETAIFALGIYTIGVRVLEFLRGVIFVVYSIMLPRFQERYEQSNHKKESLIELIEGPSLLLTTGMSVAAALSTIACQYLIANWMHEYIQGIFAMKILAWCSVIAATSILISITLITLDRLWLRFAISGSALVLITAGTWLALRWGYGISGVAVATIAGRFVGASVMIFVVGPMLWPLMKTISHYVRLYLPIVSLMAAGFLSDQLVSYGKGVLEDLSSVAFQVVIVLVLGFLCGLLLRSRTSVWDEGWKYLREKVGRR